ncbi:MAG: transglutaminase N-terminal domain-containing protein [Acidobacteriota bacterium]
MAIRVALHHRTLYRYDRLVVLSPQLVRLRPAPHSRTPVHSYALKAEPAQHFINWQQDPQGNYLARLVFPDPKLHFSVEVDLVVDLSVINPFGFFLSEPHAKQFPFLCKPTLARELWPFLETIEVPPRFEKFLSTIDRTPRHTTAYLFDLNARLTREIQYTIRMEPGVQTPERTLESRSGSCRDSAWLQVQLLRRLGLAGWFVSG